MFDSLPGGMELATVFLVAFVLFGVAYTAYSFVNGYADGAQ